jgi:hypothetical protein
MGLMGRNGLRNLAAGVVSAVALSLSLAGCADQGGSRPTAAVAPKPGSSASVVGLRRLTEDQYRNSVADIFGPDIKVVGRFEPILRPPHQLVAVGATNAAITPTGFEQFDFMARSIASQVFDEKHRAAFLDCAPADANQADDKCAEATLVPLGRYIFRRPLTKGEQQRFVAAARQGTSQTGTFIEGLQLALSAMLVSPDFLYILETAEADPAKAGALRLDNYSRAARLSFTLWNTTPNDRLLKAAEAGELTDDTKLGALADYMVASPRLVDGVRAFFSDMLIYEKFEDLTKDPVIYPQFSLPLAKALAEQLQLTILDHVLTRNGDYRELFTTRNTVMTRILAPLYETHVDRSTGWVPYEFPAQGNRAGLLSQAGFVALYAHPGRSSPTLRGRAIRELLMCQPVPDPPGNVDFQVVQDTNNKVLRTARARLSQHNTNPVCAGCHKITDPIGLTLEQFDGSGAFRVRENDADIDVGGALDGKTFSGPAGLGGFLASNPATTECVSQRAIEYATGREVREEDATRIYADFAAGGYRIRSLFRQIAASPSLYRIATQPLQSKPQQTAMVSTNRGVGK